ncbi:hypothetical protein KI387_026162, partial [Taxus chinensis]
FSISWWAYTYPMTSVSIATIRYSQQVTHPLTQGLAVLLSLVATITVASLFVTTLLHAFFWKTLFPNDMTKAATTNRTFKKKKIFAKANEIQHHVNQRNKGTIRNGFDVIRRKIKNKRDRLLESSCKKLPVYPNLEQPQAQVEKAKLKASTTIWVIHIEGMEEPVKPFRGCGLSSN